MIVAAEALEGFASAALAAAGLRVADADLVAEALVAADLRGVHSHGVQSLPWYVDGFLHGGIAANVACPVLADAGALALLDGQNGLGIITCTKAMDMAIERARVHGVAFVGVNNSNHCGAAAFYTMRALAHDQLGYCTTNSPAVMAPWGGREARLGSNPVSYAIPAGEQPPIVLDMACTAALRNTMRKHAERGTPIPPGWALDSAGRPTTDALAALGGAVLPMGEHKGYGLAVVNEVLSAALTGALFSFEMTSQIASQLTLGERGPESWGGGHLLGAFDVGKLVDIGAFKQRIDHLIASLKETGGGPEETTVYLPGELEHHRRQELLVQGIPLPEPTWTALEGLAAKLGTEMPVPTAVA